MIEPDHPHNRRAYGFKGLGSLRRQSLFFERKTHGAVDVALRNELWRGVKLALKLHAKKHGECDAEYESRTLIPN